MSEEPSPSPPPPEPEALPGAQVALVLLATLAVFGASTAVVFGLERAWSKGRIAGSSAPVPEPAYEAKINLLEQVPFRLAVHTRNGKAEQERLLSTYGWVDRERGIAHEPVDVAIDDLLREEGAK